MAQHGTLDEVGWVIRHPHGRRAGIHRHRSPPAAAAAPPAKSPASSAPLMADASGFPIIGARCSTCGTFKVYVDDVLKATVDTRRPRTTLRASLYSARLTGVAAPHRDRS